jgi:hypothetical protein
MFAKFTHIHGYGGGGHGRRPATTAAPFNNSHPAARAGGRKAPRRILTCRWRETPPTGALTCVWGFESVDSLANDEPQITRLIGRLKRWLSACAAEPLPSLAAI